MDQFIGMLYLSEVIDPFISDVPNPFLFVIM